MQFFVYHSPVRALYSIHKNKSNRIALLALSQSNRFMLQCSGFLPLKILYLVTEARHDTKRGLALEDCKLHACTNKAGRNETTISDIDNGPMIFIHRRSESNSWQIRYEME